MSEGVAARKSMMESSPQRAMHFIIRIIEIPNEPFVKTQFTLQIVFTGKIIFLDGRIRRDV
jgi:hypothetical protein